MVYEGRLRDLALLGLESRKLKGDLTVVCNYLIRDYKLEENRPFSGIQSRTTNGKGRTTAWEILVIY